MAEKLLILNGPHAGVKTKADRPRIEIGDAQYEQITDPDSGARLGAYVYVSRLEKSRRAQLSLLRHELRLMAKRWTLRRYRATLEAAARHLDLVLRDRRP